jgi:DNA-binding CsgD family transcriptional regulator
MRVKAHKETEREREEKRCAISSGRPPQIAAEREREREELRISGGRRPPQIAMQQITAKESEWK